MRHHTERIRRIQALCAKLDDAIQDSHAVQRTVEELQAESWRLLQDLRPVERPAPARKPARERTRRTRSGE